MTVIALIIPVISGRHDIARSMNPRSISRYRVIDMNPNWDVVVMCFCFQLLLGVHYFSDSWRRRLNALEHVHQRQ